jgi:hypothetical protein
MVFPMNPCVSLRFQDAINIRALLFGLLAGLEILVDQNLHGLLWLQVSYHQRSLDVALPLIYLTG